MLQQGTVSMLWKQVEFTRAMVRTREVGQQFVRGHIEAVQDLQMV